MYSSKLPSNAQGTYEETFVIFAKTISTNKLYQSIEKDTLESKKMQPIMTNHWYKICTPYIHNKYVIFTVNVIQHICSRDMYLSAFER